MRPRSSPRRAGYRIFTWPAIIGLATVVGLVMGLLGDGGWDIAAWLGLALPIAACRNLPRDYGAWAAARRCLRIRRRKARLPIR